MYMEMKNRKKSREQKLIIIMLLILKAYKHNDR